MSDVYHLMLLKLKYFSSFTFACRLSAEGVPLYGNIMYDRRIVRGNTYAQHTLPAVSIIIVQERESNSYLQEGENEPEKMNLFTEKENKYLTHWTS